MPGLERAPADQLGEGLALDQLHHEERLLVLRADVVDRDQAGVVEPGQDPGLALVTQVQRVVADVGAEHLDGDLPGQDLVGGSVDVAHPATPEELAEQVRRPDGSPGRVCCCSQTLLLTMAKPRVSARWDAKPCVPSTCWTVSPGQHLAPASAETARTASAPWQGGVMAMSPPDERKAPAPALRAPANLVSRRAVTYWTVRAAEGWLLLLVGQVAWFWLDDSHRGLRVVALLVTVLVAAGHLAVMPRWRYRVHRWEVSPHRGLHPVRLAHPGAPDRADLADPDRRHPARAAGAAVRADQRHGHHRLGGRAAAIKGLDDADGANGSCASSPP